MSTNNFVNGWIMLAVSPLEDGRSNSTLRLHSGLNPELLPKDSTRGRPLRIQPRVNLRGFSYPLTLLITKCVRRKLMRTDRSRKIRKVKIAVRNACTKSRFPANLCFSYSLYVITNAASAARNPNTIPMTIENTSISPAIPHLCLQPSFCQPSFSDQADDEAEKLNLLLRSG